MTRSFSLQRLLWSISGAETEILEKCRTDHKRFGAIGATIAMTSFIAFLSGTSAAWFFTQKGSDTTGNIGWAIAFGLVWATLIFCIDRSLVITLKKSPDRNSKLWWVTPLASRAALAMIIAFMVSIPLELVVFEDFIDEQEAFWKENKSNTLSLNSRAHKESKEAKDNIGQGMAYREILDKQKESLENDRASILAEIAVQKNKLNNPTTQTYINARKNYQAASAAVRELQNELKSLQLQLDNAPYKDKNRIQIQISSGLSKLNNQKTSQKNYYNTMQSEISKWNASINSKISEYQKALNSKENEISQKQEDINTTQAQILADQARRIKAEQQRDSLVEEHNKTMSEGNRFIQNFEILEYAVSRHLINCHFCEGVGEKDGETCNNCQGSGKVLTDLPTEWYFLWLIRLLFFIIELLPTVVKIVMPIGAYDKMVYAEEKEMERYLNSSEYLDRIRAIHDSEIQSHEEQLRLSKTAELEIKKHIMEKLRAAQIEIANIAIEKWRETELKKLNQNSLKETSITSQVNQNSPNV